MLKPWNLTDRELILAGLEAGELAHELALRFERAFAEINDLKTDSDNDRDKIDELIGELDDAQNEIAELKNKTRKKG